MMCDFSIVATVLVGMRFCTVFAVQSVWWVVTVMFLLGQETSTVELRAKMWG